MGRRSEADVRQAPEADTSCFSQSGREIRCLLNTAVDPLLTKTLHHCSLVWSCSTNSWWETYSSNYAHGGRTGDTRSSAGKICEVVETWERARRLEADDHDEAVEYFRRRYFSAGRFTHYFDELNLRLNDRSGLVTAVLNGSDDDPCRPVAAVLIIILRFRNNLFHGVKWQYQLDNFTCANAVLACALEQHGRLDEGRCSLKRPGARVSQSSEG